LAEEIQQRLLLISQVVELVKQSSRSDTSTISTVAVQDDIHQGNTHKFYKSYTFIIIRWIYLVHLNETSHSEQINQNFGDIQPTVSTTLSNTTQVPQTIPALPLSQVEHEEPMIIIQPKAEWHYRNMKDLAKKRHPFLAGDGPQRTLPRVKVKH
jgi:hypothetical protein